MKTNKNITS